MDGAIPADLADRLQGAIQFSKTMRIFAEESAEEVPKGPGCRRVQKGIRVLPHAVDGALARSALRSDTSGM